MTRGNSNSSQRRRVEEARRAAREALGDKARLDQPTGTAKYVPTTRSEPQPRKSEAVYVLTIGEVAARLGISRVEVERMIAAGKLTGLPTGFTVTVPVSDVQRMLR